jgi:hypothetical protein
VTFLPGERTVTGPGAAPLAIDLFCGLGGWTAGLLAEGYYVVGFDIERHEYGEHCYPGRLVIQDVLTLHGAQFKDAALIVASPPCQEFSYMAMPWKRAKAKAAAIRADESGRMLAELTRLFDACFRIQMEASLAAGRRIPLIVENVKGAQPWVGRSRWNFGSYHLWGDVPALMPIAAGRQATKVPGVNWQDFGRPGYAHPSFRDGAFKSSGMNWSDPTKRGQDFTRIAGKQAAEGRKGAGAGAEWFDGNLCRLPSASPRRKAASAMIAKIPLPLSRYIAATFRPCAR